MLKREMDSLLWKINYKDIQWAKTTTGVDSVSDETDETEVRKHFFNKLNCNRQERRENASERAIWLGQLALHLIGGAATTSISYNGITERSVQN